MLPSTRRPLLVGLGMLLVLGIALGAFAVTTVTASAAPKLVWGGSWENNSKGVNVQGAPYTFTDLNPCVSKDSVTVVKIAPTRSSGIALTAWGSRLNPADHGVPNEGGRESATVVQAGFQNGPRRVVNLCSNRMATGDKIANDYEFAIELHRTGAATGWVYGLTVTYHSGGGTHTVQWPEGYILCGNTSPRYPSSTMNGMCS
jgi:hypothetical protein